MKELLYKPEGIYVSFVVDWQAPYNTPIYNSLEAYCKKWGISEEAVIRNILIGSFNNDFYIKNDLPKIKKLKEKDFRVVEV